MLTCYIDESGTDNDSPVAVVGGIVLNESQFFWLDMAWRKCLADHHIPWPLHMREFGPRGALKDVRSEERRALFLDVTRLINDSKTFSAVATLSSEQYRTVFAGVSELSMYGACYTNLVMSNGIGAQSSGYSEDIAYVLDEGNPYKHQILDAHAILRQKESNVGPIAFESDDKLSALQVADVVSWSTRRKQAAALKSGFEPLEALFNDEHVEIQYKPEWMIGVADALRAKMKVHEAQA